MLWESNFLSHIFKEDEPAALSPPLLSSSAPSHLHHIFTHHPQHQTHLFHLQLIPSTTPQPSTMQLTHLFTLLASPLLLSVLAAPQGSTYNDALQHIKADHPGISDTDASTAAWGYIEALANMEFDKAAPTGIVSLIGLSFDDGEVTDAVDRLPVMMVSRLGA